MNFDHLKRAQAEAAKLNPRTKDLSEYSDVPEKAGGLTLRWFSCSHHLFPAGRFLALCDAQGKPFKGQSACTYADDIHGTRQSVTVTFQLWSGSVRFYEDGDEDGAAKG